MIVEVIAPNSHKPYQKGLLWDDSLSREEIRPFVIYDLDFRLDTGTVYIMNGTDHYYEPSKLSYLSELYMLGFLTRYERDEGRSGGVYHEYELDLDAETAIELRKQIEGESKVQ